MKQRNFQTLFRLFAFRVCFYLFASLFFTFLLRIHFHSFPYDCVCLYAGGHTSMFHCQCWFTLHKKSTALLDTQTIVYSLHNYTTDFLHRRDVVYMLLLTGSLAETREKNPVFSSESHRRRSTSKLKDRARRYKCEVRSSFAFHRFYF